MPQAIKEYFSRASNLQDIPMYAQIATHAPDELSIRTMRLFEYENDGSLVFLTNTQSRKWQNLKIDNKIAALFLDLPHNVQICASGIAKLYSGKEEPLLGLKYWAKIPRDARKTYFDMLYADLETAPDNFGIIILTPHLWEILEINSQDYKMSKRIRYVLKENIWVEETLKLV